MTATEIYAHWKPVEHTLKFDYNYPADDPNPQTEPGVVEIEGNCETQYTPPETPKHPHYTFAGWYTAAAGGNLYTPPATVEETRMVYAHWTGKQYSVTFDAGAGASPAQEQTVTVTYPAYAAAPAYPPLKTGYGFTGWFTSADAGTVFASYIPAEEGGAKFYAHWIAGSAVLMLNYNYSGAPPSIPKDTPYNTTLSFPDKPSRTHYTFEGWYDDPNGGTRYDSSTISGVLINNYTGTPAVLYARWNAEKLTVTFYKNSPASSGDNTISSQVTVDYGSNITPPGLPVLSGYVAKGWYEGRSGGRKISSVVITGNKSFYAQWLSYSNTSLFPANASGGNAITYVKTTTGFDEVHKFTKSGTLNFNAGYLPSTSRILVVGGGGGAGGGNFPSSGGGAGRMVGHNNYALTTAPVYAVTVGAGGKGGDGSGHGTISDGGDGGASVFKIDGGVEIINAPGGGRGGAHNGGGNCGTGTIGGSSGGGGYYTTTSVYTGTYPSGGFSYGNAGGRGSTNGDYAGGGGGAGGAGSWGSPDGGRGGGGEYSDIINGSYTLYAKGGNVAPQNTAWSGSSGGANTGNGGQGAWNGNGGAGGSGIVVVRFPYKYMGE